MHKLSFWLKQLVKKFVSPISLTLNFLLVSCLVLTCLILTFPFPAQAATKLSSQLEQQVLQILREHPEAIIESVQAYQQQQQNQVQQRQQAFVQQMRTNPQEVIGNSPVAGATSAKAVLIEFSDFQCPYCGTASKDLKKIIAKHKNNLTLVYKHFPLTSIHSQAMPAAKVAWAAQQQGKFWEYQEALFANQKILSDRTYLDIATKLNLDMDKFAQDREIAEKFIQEDMQLGDKLGLTGTPFFVMSSDNFSGAVQLSDIDKLLSQK
jgi:protein-disulfide isomerase